MSAWVLREAAARDRDAVLDLWVEAWTAAMPDIDFEARRAWFSDRLDALNGEGAVTILAEDRQGGLAGLATFDAAAHYLDQLAVHPAQRGGGLARQLLDRVKALSAGRLDLHVNQDNARALRFYEREGFRRLEAGVNPRSGLPIWHMAWGP